MTMTPRPVEAFLSAHGWREIDHASGRWVRNGEDYPESRTWVEAQAIVLAEHAVEMMGNTPENMQR